MEEKIKRDTTKAVSQCAVQHINIREMKSNERKKNKVQSFLSFSMVYIRIL